MSHESNMSDKKRTTVTTIDTHEVWVIRRAVPEPSDEDATIMPAEIARPAAISPLEQENNTPNKQREETTT